MNFGELRFWLLLALGLSVILLLRAGIRIVRPSLLPEYDKAGLASLGLFLLLCVSTLTFLIYGFVLLLTFFGLRLIVRHAPPPEALKPKAETLSPWLFVLIPLQLAPLVYYKYAGFVYNTVLGFRVPDFLHMLIPVGISFYTFQKIAFVIDTLVHRQPIPRFLDYLNFAGFFPQIVAGPIERRDDLLPQMQRFRFRWTAEDIDGGLRLVVVGLFFKCCLADNLAGSVDRSALDNPFLIWLANVVFGLRIYYDFAGYSLIAVGVARCLGVRLTLNFLSPYTSTSIAEFWRRWHITLSQWFRDYLYVPLGGGRVRWWAFNVALVFIVSGIWHGAGWNFVFWGALHGLFLIGCRLTGISLPRAAGWTLTMLAAFFAWLCFYETNTSALLHKIGTLASPAAYSLANLRAALAQLASPQSFVLLCFLLLASLILWLEWRSLVRANQPYALLLRTPALLVLLALAILLAPGKSNEFIYFAF